jgi:hypothetical protein
MTRQVTQKLFDQEKAEQFAGQMIAISGLRATTGKRI